jgi:hypothetical protein
MERVGIRAVRFEDSGEDFRAPRGNRRAIGSTAVPSRVNVYGIRLPPQLKVIRMIALIVRRRSGGGVKRLNALGAVFDVLTVTRRAGQIVGCVALLQRKQLHRREVVFAFSVNSKRVADSLHDS